MLWFMMAALAVLQSAEASPVSRSQIDQARDLFDERLLDYPSARFRDVTGDDRVICGFVNAKNRMGAYSGWTGFVLVQTDGASTLRMVEDGQALPLVYELYCTEGRTPVSRDYSDRLKAD